MSHDESRDTSRRESRDPSLTKPSQANKEHRWSSNAGSSGSADARENPPQAAPGPIPDENHWLIAYRHQPLSGTVIVLGFRPPVVEILSRRPWATRIPDEGWAIPEAALAHVERLLASLNATMFDVDGSPSPAQRTQPRDDDHARTKAVLADIHDARDQHDPTQSHKAYLAIKAELEQRAAERARAADHEATPRAKQTQADQ